MLVAFVVGVASSLIASVVVLIAGWFLSGAFRRFLIRFVGKMCGSDIEDIYPTQAIANPDVAKELRVARRVCFFGGRGNELTRETFAALWASDNRRLETVRILLPDPGSSTRDSWLSRREREMETYDRGYVGSMIETQIRSNIQYLMNKTRDRSDIEIRLYDFPHLGRIVMTDQVAFVTPYTDRAHGSESRCLRLRSSGPLYNFAERIFSEAWSTARVITPESTDIGSTE
jgi:hypothetical protein